MAEEIITSTNVETATDHEYNASEIQVLKGLEAVRKRPGMYIGSTGERGLHHLVYEIVDNAIDEALAGYCNHIEVKILKDNIIQVTDNGRGIPVDIQADTGLPAVTVVYTILHAGGKFGGENSGYKVAGGLHGVGASVVNACSEWLRVNVRRDGHEYEQTFRRGDPDGPLKCLGTVAEGVTGTRVTFKPDPEMFKDTTVYNFETLEKRLREESFLNAGVKITLTDERELYTPVLEDGQEGDPCYRTEVMCYEGGIKSFVTYLGEKRNLEVLHPNVIYLKGQTERGMAEIALQYNSSYNELLLSFANNVNTPDGGTHEEGFKNSLTRVFNDYGRSHGLLKDKDENLSGADVREGLICVISVKLQEAERVLAETGVNIDAMVEDYRNSLLTYRLDRYYMDRVDTVVSDSLVADYYAMHQPEFRLDRDIVKGRIVRLPASFRLRTKLKELMGSPNAERQQDFLDLAVKNGLTLTVFDEWVGFDEFLNRLPTVRGKSYDYLLTGSRIEELTDGDYKYYVQITDHAAKGQQAPLEWVENVVRNIIYNKRGSDAVRRMEDSLYHAALENHTLKIYLKTNRE